MDANIVGGTLQQNKLDMFQYIVSNVKYVKERTIKSKSSATFLTMITWKVKILENL